MPHLPRIARNAVFRFALLHTLVFVVSVAAIGLIAESFVTHALKQQAHQRVEEEASELVGEFEQYGSAAFRKLIDSQAGNGARHLHYAVIGSDGTRVAGEHFLARTAMGGMPLDASVATEVSISRKDVMLVARRPLSDETTLLIADDLTSIEDVEDLVSRAFAIVLALSAVLGLLAGIVLSRALLRRVNTVTHTAEAIIGGDLSRRIECTGSGDDFDRLATTLNAMLDRIGDLIQNLHQVTNDIAHDLRTPLSRLRQTLERAKTHTGTRSDYEDAIEGAIAEADGLLVTFSALLRIAQIEAGARRSAFRPVDLADIVETVCEAYGPTAEEGGRSIVSNAVRGVFINGDRELLIQLFANLVENALAHTPVDTCIRIDLKPQSVENAFVLIEVSDNGPGIPIQEREKVLRRFYRLEQSRTTPGNGLGLSTVAAIAELHHATLQLADNRPGLCIRIRFKI